MGLREEFILTPADLKRSPMELFSLCENVLALKPQAKSPDARKWNENTQSTYHRMMDRMQTFYFEPLGLPFDELEFEHFDQAVEAYASQSRGRGKENGKISEATRDKLRSILKSLTDFVHEKLPEYADPFWGSIWNYRPMVLPQNVSATRKKELRQIRKDEIAEIVKLPRSLQVREEIKFATVLREKLTQPDGVAIGGLLMLYLGLRPGECCGLTYGAIQPLVQDGQTRVLYIYQALDTSNRKKHQLKTKNAYRVLPIPDELDVLLKERLNYVESQLTLGQMSRIKEFPIVNSPEDFAQPCRRKHFGDTIANLLRSIRTSEESLAYASYLLTSERSVREESPTAYLLRRHYATILSSVCNMQEEEIQYLMGHDIRNADIRHADLLDVDWLLRMHKKLGRRHIFTEPPDASQQPEDVEGDITEYQLICSEADLKKSKGIRIDVWNSCPADALTVHVKEESGPTEKAVLYESDYRPMGEVQPPMIRFDRAYYRALRKSSNKSAAHTKTKEKK